MDGISLIEAIVLYSVLLSPLLSITLLIVWASKNTQNKAQSQLHGIIILFALGFLAINSPFILIIEAIALILLITWIIAYKNLFIKGQLLVILLTFILQLAYYLLFFASIAVEYDRTLYLLTIIPILSMGLLYSWTFGNKRSTNGRPFIIIVFVVQFILAILNIALSFMVS